MPTMESPQEAKAPKNRRWRSLLAAGVLLAGGILAGTWFVGRSNWRDLERDLPRIGTIDFYGLRTVTEQQVRDKLNIREGDAIPVDIEDINVPMKIQRWLSGSKPVEIRRDVEDRLKQIPGVARAALEMGLGAGSSKASLFVGIEEGDAPRFDYRPLPRGSAALPNSMTAAYDQHISALETALAKGDKSLDEDDSQGHALSSDPVMRAQEEKAIAFDASNLALVRTVLKDSADATQRAVAAWIMGYAPDKRAILGDLIDAARDPDDTVRNNATRAIGVIAEFASDRPELGIRIDPSPFVDMLNSLTWTDRNKATMVLSGLTENRSAEALRQLRERALPSLTEMARWNDSHSRDGLELLGRIAGLDEKDIQSAWDRGERERIIAMATANTNYAASESRPGH
jgi:hypothetical protein